METKSSVLKALILGIFLLPLQLFAQDDVGELFISGPADARKLVNAYMNPFFRGLGVGLNSGWNTSAKTKGFLRFDLRITATAAFVPKEDQTFNVNALGLTNIKPAEGQNGIGPTAFGDNDAGSIVELYANGTATGQTFKLPKGTGFNIVPSPQIQLTIGLPKNIDVSLRLVPNIKLGDDAGKVNLIGVGTKIEVLPLIMGKNDKLLPFDLAVALGYTRLNYNLPLHVNTSSASSNQKLALNIDGFSVDAIISKKLLFFTPFASIGYNSASSNLRALGTYEFDVPLTLDAPSGKQSFTDPITLKQTNLSDFKAALGFQLQFSLFKLYGSYTTSKYSYINAGIGLGIGQ